MDLVQTLASVQHSLGSILRSWEYTTCDGYIQLQWIFRNNFILCKAIKLLNIENQLSDSDNAAKAKSIFKASKPKSIHINAYLSLHSVNSIKESILERNNLIAETVSKDNNNQHLHASDKLQIINHCNEYSKIVPLIGSVISNSKSSNQLTEHEKFWQTNQNLERQLQSQLRQLKNIDTIIDNIVNEQFDKCNQIDQIQQTIRIILSKKDSNHISKAQPYYHQKQECLVYLNEKKQEKQAIKDEKLKFIKRILSLLDHLRRHREMGLKMCAVDKQRRTVQAEQILLDRVINDFKQVVKNQKELAALGQQKQNLLAYILQGQRKIVNCSNDLLDLIQAQNEACLEFQQIAKLKSETQCFQNTLLSIFGVQLILRKPKNELTTQIQSIVSRLQKFARDNKQKQKQVFKIQQGIETTKKTIGIFEHIIEKIETENSRKKQLLKDIETIQQRHNEQDRRLTNTSEVENEIQKLKLKRNQLNKNLESKLNEANVTAYKNIHEQLTKIDVIIRDKESELADMKKNASDNARRLYEETANLQQQYEDILSEIVPSIWLKGNDFNKQDSIRDLNIYLLKTLKRLSIAD